jgi:hypothetical protein
MIDAFSVRLTSHGVVAKSYDSLLFQIEDKKEYGVCFRIATDDPGRRRSDGKNNISPHTRAKF